MSFQVIHDKVGARDVSKAVYKATGEVIPIARRGNIYEWEIEVVRYRDVEHVLRPFQGAGRKTL